jgi:ATPase subunit of ABC transporter with duplicated ATPase domains
MAPKARQAKGKARLNSYEALLAQDSASGREPDKLEIYIPPGPRLSDQVIEFDNVAKGFGDKLLFENLTFSLPRAGIVGVIGANGAGKTTLFRMITAAAGSSAAPSDTAADSSAAPSDTAADAGTITIGSTVELAYVDQSRDSLDATKSVYDEITQGDEIIKLGNREMNGRAYVASFNFKGSDQQKLVGALSGGERNRVHLAKVLRRGGNVLLLDEPTNDLDVDTLRALEGALESFAGCAVVISHDRWFLDRVATHVLAFEGDSTVRWFEGNFSDYETLRRKEVGDVAPTPIRYKPLTR